MYLLYTMLDNLFAEVIMLLLIGPSVVFKIISVGQQLFGLKKKSPQEAAGEVAGLNSMAQSSRIAKAAEGRAA